MAPFAHARADSIAAATSSLARHRSDSAREPGADFFAGGTDLMQLMGEHLRNPDRIIEICALCRREGCAAPGNETKTRPSSYSLVNGNPRCAFRPCRPTS